LHHHERTVIERQIEATDRGTNRLVYELCAKKSPPRGRASVEQPGF
jgi:hypothetical protein